MKDTLLTGKEYVSAAHTDIRRTFKRIREAMKIEQKEREATSTEAQDKVTPLRGKIRDLYT